MTNLEKMTKDIADATVEAMQKHASPEGSIPTADSLKAVMASAYSIQLGLLKDHTRENQQLLIMELILPGYMGLLHNLKDRFL